VYPILNLKLEDFTSPYYSVEKYKDTYSGVIHPIKDQCMRKKFPYPDLNPPFVVKKCGPRPKDRKRGMEEGWKKPKRSTCVRCKHCKGLHHNSRTCPLLGLGEQSTRKGFKRKDNGGDKRPQGRPRKLPRQSEPATNIHQQQLVEVADPVIQI